MRETLLLFEDLLEHHGLSHTKKKPFLHYTNLLDNYLNSNSKIPCSIKGLLQNKMFFKKSLAYTLTYKQNHGGSFLISIKT